MKKLVLATMLAGTGLVAGAAPSSAELPDTYCNNGTAFPTGIDDVWLALGDTNLVGVDLGDLGNDPSSVGVCVLDRSTVVYVDTTGAVTAKVFDCPDYDQDCSVLLGTTGVTDAGLGYNVWVNGTKVACLSADGC